MTKCRFKSQSYLAPSSGISIVWKADSWRRRNAVPQLSALQTMEMPLDGDNTKDSQIYRHWIKSSKVFSWIVII